MIGDGRRHIPLRAAWWLSTRMTRFGEQRGIEWLMYNPIQLAAYHQIAKLDAAAVAAAFSQVFPRAHRFVDVGAGSGAFAAGLRDQGFSVNACERSTAGRLFARLQGVSAVDFQLDSVPPARITAQHDVAYSFEVAEHVNVARGDALVRFLVQLAPRVVFTAAPPGQGGLGHINERPKEYWIDRFSDAGALYQEQTTHDLHHAFQLHGVAAPYLLANAMVFKRA